MHRHFYEVILWTQVKKSKKKKVVLMCNTATLYCLKTLTRFFRFASQEENKNMLSLLANALNERP